MTRPPRAGSRAMRPASLGGAAPEACPTFSPLWSHHQISPRPGQAGQLAPSSLRPSPGLLPLRGCFSPRFSLPPTPPRAHTSQTPAGFSNQREVGHFGAGGQEGRGSGGRPQAGRGSRLERSTPREGRRGGGGRGGVGGAAQWGGAAGPPPLLGAVVRVALSVGLASSSVFRSSVSASALFPPHALHHHQHQDDQPESLRRRRLRSRPPWNPARGLWRRRDRPLSAKAGKGSPARWPLLPAARAGWSCLHSAGKLAMAKTNPASQRPAHPVIPGHLETPGVGGPILYSGGCALSPMDPI